MKKRTLLAVAGELIYCRQGHPTYKVKHDIYLEDNLYTHDFVPIGIDEQQRPSPFLTVGICYQCGDLALHSLDVRATKFVRDPHGKALAKAFEIRARDQDDVGSK